MAIGFAQAQGAFAAALLDSVAALPPFLRTASPCRTESAFSVHRNNVASGLVRVLMARFPVIVRLVGEESFAVLALRFITLHPPRSPLLMIYGEDFPEFLRGVASTPASDYLADIARLEVARGQAFHAADAEPVPLTRFAALTAAQLPSLKVVLHPSLRLLRSKHPVVSAWQANQAGADASIRQWRGEEALVARPHDEVTVTRLPDGGFAFLSTLASGEPLAGAIAAGQCDNAAFDLAANLAILTVAGIVVELR